MRAWALTSVGIVIALAACSGPDRPILDRYPQAVRLTDAELRALFPANVDYFSDKLGPSTAAFEPEGGVHYHLFSANFKDNGTWRIAGGMLCTRYEFLGSGQEQCRAVYRTEPEHYATLAPDGTQPVSFTVYR